MQADSTRRVVVDLAEECLKSVNYLCTNEDANCSRAIVVYVVTELICD